LAAPEVLTAVVIGGVVGAAWGAATAKPGEAWEGAGAGFIGGAVGGATGGLFELADIGAGAFVGGALGGGIGDVANRGTPDVGTVGSIVTGGIIGGAFDFAGAGSGWSGGLASGTGSQVGQTVYVDAPMAILDAGTTIIQNHSQQLQCQ
jgi:hypothetical protein